jgi:hypothetical protein
VNRPRSQFRVGIEYHQILATRSTRTEIATPAVANVLGTLDELNFWKLFSHHRIRSIEGASIDNNDFQRAHKFLTTYRIKAFRKQITRIPVDDDNR